METPVEEQRHRHLNVRIGHQTTPWSLLANRPTDVEDVSNQTNQSDLTDPRLTQRQAIKTFLHQKPHRVHQMVLIRRILYVIVTSAAMILAWAIGYYKMSVLALVGVIVVIIVVWIDQSKKLALITEQEIEMKLRRKKTVQVSETAEWVNLAINRWWMTCSDSVIGFMKDYIEPLLQEVVPVGIDSLELLDFDLANQTPFVKNIQIFDPPVLASPGGEFISPSSTRAIIAANMDIGLLAPDSKLTMKVRVGGRKFGYDTLVYIEGLHLSGSMQAIIHIDYEAPFPHIACISATFVRKPDLWYSVRVYKGLRITDIPLVKSWVHSFIMSIFQSLLVDPGRLEIDLMSSNPQSIADPHSSRRARGVLTITFSGNPTEHPSKYENDPRRWVTFRLGEQKYQVQLPTGRESWRATYSFLVYDLKEDMLLIKIKHRRVMYTMVLASHIVPLSSLDLLQEGGGEVEGTRCLYVHNTEANIGIDMEYSLLPPFSLNSPSSDPITKQVAGVLYIHVHSASGLSSGDADGLSDPYCVVLTNKIKVLTTHYILDTLEPKWERGVEIFVQDFTRVSLTFVVYDWDGPLVGDDFLGACKLNLMIDEPRILQRLIELEIDGSTNKKGRSFGHVTVSVIFRPVDSVARAELPGLATVSQPDTLVTSSLDSTSKRSKKAWKKLQSSSGIQPGENFGVLELSVKEGRDLVAMDRNGYSDPYIIVKYGAHEVYRTPSINKTLNPKWNCQCTLSAPPPATSIVIECWDKDQFTNDDFMGSLAFSSEELHIFENGSIWCKLQHVASGEVLLELRKHEPTQQQSQDSLSSGDISTLDEASKHLIERVTDRHSIGGSLPEDERRRTELNIPFITTTPSSRTESENSQGFPVIYPMSHSYYSSPNLNAPLESHPPLIPTTQSDQEMQDGDFTLRQRHVSNPHIHRHSCSPSLGSIDSSLSAQSGILSMTIGGTNAEDFYAAKKRKEKDVVPLSTERRGLYLETSTQSRMSAFYYNINGEVIEAEGLKGKLDHLELYIKVRLNSHPSYMRRQKFDRGPVLHKTRKLRGSSSLRWRESFMAKESPIPSDSLLTIDLKSGKNVTLGTHVITLDKFFEGNLSATKWLELGNDMRIRIQMSRQPPHGHSLDLTKLKNK